MIAYGKLDIYWPDGPVESYILDKPTVAIGRSPGNDIVLDSNSVSRYHITLLRRGDAVLAEDLDSANGTYLDGQRMRPHEQYSLRGTEEILIGDIRLIFQPELSGDTEPLAHTAPFSVPGDDYATKPIPREPLETTRRIEVVQPTYKVEVDSAEQTVTPGAHVQVTLNIENRSSQSEHYFVEVAGIPKEWVRVERSELELDAGEHVSLILSFKPLRRSDSLPGEYPVTIRVRAKSESLQPVEVPLRLHLLTYSGFGIALGTPRIDSRTPFQLHILNQGNAPLSLVFAGKSPDNDLAFEFHPPAATLGAGERQTIQGFVHPMHSTVVGRTRERQFDLLARAQDASQFLTAVEGTLIDKPFLPVWAATLVVPMLIALVLLGVGGLALLALVRPHAPVISDFSASASSILEGDTVTFSWAVADASELALQVDGGQPTVLDSKQNSLSQVVTGVGQRTFTLIARNGGASAQRDVVLTVTRAMKIDAFTVKPNPLLRYVQQDVSIQWKADGAANVYFQGIEGLTGSPDNNSYPPDGQIRLSGSPRDTFQLTLVASGSDGKQVSEAVQVEIITPECAVVSDQTEIRPGPGDVYPVSGTLRKGTKVHPDGRDQTGRWIRLTDVVATPGPASTPNPTNPSDTQPWLSASAVTCNGFSPLNLVSITVVSPVVIQTLTATPAAPTPAITAPANIVQTMTPTPILMPTPSSTPQVIMSPITHS